MMKKYFVALTIAWIEINICHRKDIGEELPHVKCVALEAGEYI